MFSHGPDFVSFHFRLSPSAALLDSRAGRVVAVFLVLDGILHHQLAGQIGALSAVDKSLFLTADRHRAFSMEGMAVCGNASAAIAALPEAAGFAAKAAPGVDSVHRIPPSVYNDSIYSRASPFSSCLHLDFML